MGEYTAGPSLVHHVALLLEARATHAERTDAAFILYG